MADKEVRIKVVTETDADSLETLNADLDSVKDNAQATGEVLQSAFEEATAEVERLEDALAEAELNGDDIEADIIADELAEAEAEAEKLQEALNNIDGGSLSDASGDADDLASSLDDATASADELSQSMGIMESAMLMDVANQIGAIGDNAEGMAQEINTASITVGQLATNVGMAEPQMVSLINYISNKTFPQAEAMAYVEALHQLGVQADKLGDSATNMDRMNDAFGLGYQNAITLTRGLANVGVSADNLPSAFNALAYAQANVNGGVETLTLGLRRQGATFNELGLNVDQVAVVMAGASKKWTDSRKLNSELGKALKDCNGDLRVLEQSLGLQAGALSNASSETGKYEGKLQDLADEEMEHKTFIDDINAGWEDMQLALAPLLSPLGSFIGLIGGIGQTALAVNSLITLGETFGFLTVTEEGLTIAQWTLNASMLANPALWLVIAIVALIGVLIYLYYTNEDVRNAINGLGQAFMEAGQIMYTAIVDAVNWIIGALQNLWNYVITLGGLLPANVNLTGNQIVDTILRVLMFVATLPIQLGIIFVNTIAKVLGFGDNFVQNMLNAGLNAVNRFINTIARLPSEFMNEVNQIIQEALNFAGRIGDILWQAGINAIKGFLGGLDRHSPGIMQREFIAEIVEMGNRVPFESRMLISNMEVLGSDVVGAFGNPKLSMGEFNSSNLNSLSNNIDFNSVSNSLNNPLVNLNDNPNASNGDIIINVYGDVDNDERIKKIVDAVRNELAWNNNTAGRTI